MKIKREALPDDDYVVEVDDNDRSFLNGGFKDCPKLGDLVIGKEVELTFEVFWIGKCNLFGVHLPNNGGYQIWPYAWLERNKFPTKVIRDATNGIFPVFEKKIKRIRINGSGAKRKRVRIGL
ncbi:hypothetical protein KAR91_28630 [Candidatus Pacearchaeota archaeon]|nr:hypothetical protein [Candidatus Pacearchaeota archaeon]